LEFSLMDNRKHWTQQQTQLRKALSSKVQVAQGIQLFLQQHAATHSAGISGGQFWSLQDEVLAGVTDAEIKTLPGRGSNSMAWLLWHTARIEDITLSFLVLEQPQVLDSEAWAGRLGFSLRDVGAGMDEPQVVSFSQQILVQGLKDYRAAVGRRTRAGMPTLPYSQMEEIVPAENVQRLLEDGSISQKAPWLAEFYTHRTKAFFLTRITSHNFLHINEAGRIPARLRKTTRAASLVQG
jgi:hypothetical protein